MLLFSAGNIQITSKVEFDELEGEGLLKEAYGPLEDFVKELKPMENRAYLKVPIHIKNEGDFIHLFNKRVDTNVVKGFYEDLFVEKDGDLYVDSSVYIPNIFAEDSKVTDAYIQKRRRIYWIVFGIEGYEGEKLVIKELLKIRDEFSKRSNYFVQDENGQWILEYFNGISKYGFVNSEDNPWCIYNKSVN